MVYFAHGFWSLVQAHHLYCIKHKEGTSCGVMSIWRKRQLFTSWKSGSRQRGREKPVKRYHHQGHYPSDLLLHTRSHLQSFQYPVWHKEVTASLDFSIDYVMALKIYSLWVISSTSWWPICNTRMLGTVLHIQTTAVSLYVGMAVTDIDRLKRCIFFFSWRGSPFMGQSEYLLETDFYYHSILK